MTWLKLWKMAKRLSGALSFFKMHLISFHFVAFHFWAPAPGAGTRPFDKSDRGGRSCRTSFVKVLRHAGTVCHNQKEGGSGRGLRFRLTLRLGLGRVKSEGHELDKSSNKSLLGIKFFALLYSFQLSFLPPCPLLFFLPSCLFRKFFHARAV